MVENKCYTYPHLPRFTKPVIENREKVTLHIRMRDVQYKQEIWQVSNTSPDLSTESFTAVHKFE